MSNGKGFFAGHGAGLHKFNWTRRTMIVKLPSHPGDLNVSFGMRLRPRLGGAFDEQRSDSVNSPVR
jgi:hypothetical protein